MKILLMKMEIQVAQKKVKKAFENAVSSPRVELTPSKIKVQWKEFKTRNNGMSDPIGGLDTKTHQKNKDPSDEDGDTGMGDLTRVSVSLGEISLEGKKSWESNMGDSDNTRDGG
nr:hypothetical protein [Tanacetum cinerariifolium]